MIKITLTVVTGITLLAACSGNTPADDEEFILVKGGAFMNKNSKLYGKGALADFYIARAEVTQKQWSQIMGTNPSSFKGDSLPVETVSWYDCIEYCNKRSLKEGFKPYYTIDKKSLDSLNKSEFDSLKFIVSVNAGANGYRLPTEAEWEYAAGGGQKSKSYRYSGSNDINEVAWYWKNSGDRMLEGVWSWPVLEKNRARSKPGKLKKPNELDLYDMSGNVREWCEDWYQDEEMQPGRVRSQRGGGWMGAEYRCEVLNRHSFEASGKGPDQGLRLCRGM